MDGPPHKKPKLEPGPSEAPQESQSQQHTLISTQSSHSGPVQTVNNYQISQEAFMKLDKEETIKLPWAVGPVLFLLTTDMEDEIWQRVEWSCSGKHNGPVIVYLCQYADLTKRQKVILQKIEMNKAEIKTSIRIGEKTLAAPQHLKALAEKVRKDVGLDEMPPVPNQDLPNNLQMKAVDFRSIEMKNFGPFSEKQKLLFTPGLILVSGPLKSLNSNGVGKSFACGTALIWCLTSLIEQRPCGSSRTDIVAHKDTEECSVSVNLSLTIPDESCDEYTITRLRGNSHTSLTLYNHTTKQSSAETEQSIGKLLFNLDLQTDAKSEFRDFLLTTVFWTPFDFRRGIGGGRGSQFQKKIVQMYGISKIRKAGDAAEDKLGRTTKLRDEIEDEIKQLKNTEKILQTEEEGAKRLRTEAMTEFNAILQQQPLLRSFLRGDIPEDIIDPTVPDLQRLTDFKCDLSIDCSLDGLDPKHAAQVVLTERQNHRITAALYSECHAVIKGNQRRVNYKKKSSTNALRKMKDGPHACGMTSLKGIAQLLTQHCNIDVGQVEQKCSYAEFQAQEKLLQNKADELQSDLDAFEKSVEKLKNRLEASTHLKHILQCNCIVELEKHCNDTRRQVEITAQQREQLMTDRENWSSFVLQSIGNKLIDPATKLLKAWEADERHYQELSYVCCFKLIVEKRISFLSQEVVKVHENWSQENRLKNYWRRLEKEIISNGANSLENRSQHYLRMMFCPTTIDSPDREQISVHIDINPNGQDSFQINRNCGDRNLPLSTLSNAEWIKFDIALFLCMSNIYLREKQCSVNLQVFDECFAGVDHVGILFMLGLFRHLLAPDSKWWPDSMPQTCKSVVIAAQWVPTPLLPAVFHKIVEVVRNTDQQSSEIRDPEDDSRSK